MSDEDQYKDCQIRCAARRNSGLGMWMRRR
jgi:hypothetical protein